MRLLVHLLALAQFASSAAAVDLILGHFEYQLDYNLPESGPVDAGWQASISYDLDGSFADDEGVVRLDVDGLRLLAAPSTKVDLPGAFPPFELEGGDPLWLLSQNNVPGELFLGWRAIYDQGIFQVNVGGNYTPSPLGSIGTKLLSVTGSGPQRGGKFGMWTSSGFGGFEFHYNTTDGIDLDDELSPIPSGSHSHYNWGFTRPGSYEVTFRNEGKLNPQFGNEVTRSESTLRFVIPHDGVLTGQARWRLGSGAEAVSIYDQEMQVDYAPDQVVCVASDGQFRMALAGSGEVSLGQVGVVDPASISFPEAESIDLALLKQSGPGAITFEQDVSDSVFGFTEDGIYRVTLQASQGGVTGQPFTLVFLVNLAADYSYAEWADSFERTHSLASGTLGDRLADYDRDGLGNGLEYLLFWHGVDPVESDGALLPRPRFVNGRAEIEFLRDLHKDDFANTPLELSAAFSPDLQGPWQPWRRLFAEGNAQGFYESGAERGNETSVVMRRKLVVPDATEKSGFFRFEQRTRN
ncbi:MAG: choice-of-anchor M domain-containing protein [Akkermansiaceae bacterium]|jgi:surface-anchored protein